MTALVFIGCAMIAAGLFFAVRQIAGDTAGGSALKGISLAGPAWLVLIGMGTGVIVFDRWLDHDATRKSVADKETIGTTPPTMLLWDEDEWFPGGFTYGDNVMLDVLWQECDLEVWLSCDDLFFQSDVNSDYEWFGATCGGRVEVVGLEDGYHRFCDESNNADLPALPANN